MELRGECHENEHEGVIGKEGPGPLPVVATISETHSPLPRS